jgi:hypothetical protein
MPQPQQDLKNHPRFVPLFHFVVFGLIVLNLVHASRRLLPFSADSFYPLSLAVALMLLAWFTRAFPLTVQDRVIRLEERLRLEKLAPELAARSGDVTPSQWTALRFASDAELPGLVGEVLAGKLSKPGDIKRAIRVWRADHLRA